jgi:hypothetical protein
LTGNMQQPRLTEDAAAMVNKEDAAAVVDREDAAAVVDREDATALVDKRMHQQWLQERMKQRGETKNAAAVWVAKRMRQLVKIGRSIPPPLPDNFSFKQDDILIVCNPKLSVLHTCSEPHDS